MSDSNAAYTMEWYIPKRVIFIRYNEVDITTKILQQLSIDLEKFYQEGKAPIHIISDNINQGNLKVGLQDLKQNLVVMKQANWGCIMLLGINSLVSLFATVIGNIFGIRIRRVQSIEDAIHALKQLDSSLSEMVEKNK